MGSLSHAIRVEMFFFVFIKKRFTNILSLATKVLRLITWLLITLNGTITLLIIELYHLVEPLIKKFLILITCRVKTHFVLKRCSSEFWFVNFFCNTIFLFLFKFILTFFYKKFSFKIVWLTDLSMEFRYVAFIQIFLSHRKYRLKEAIGKIFSFFLMKRL